MKKKTVNTVSKVLFRNIVINTIIVWGHVYEKVLPWEFHDHFGFFAGI
jgi:hypothetical protein